LVLRHSLCALGGSAVAARYDGDVTDIFDLQDRIASSVARAILPNLERVEIERAQRKRPESLEAYDLYLRALPHIHAMTSIGNDEAIRLLKQAFAVDSHFAGREFTINCAAVQSGLWLVHAPRRAGRGCALRPFGLLD